MRRLSRPSSKQHAEAYSHQSQLLSCGLRLQLDGQIWREIIRTHEGGEDIEQPDGSAGVERELLVPEPWAGDLYNYWLQAMIDRENGEIGKYNQTSQLYNQAYLTYAGYYNRTHMPIGCGPMKI